MENEGLRQGDPLSAIRFNLVLAKVLRENEIKTKEQIITFTSSFSICGRYSLNYKNKRRIREFF